MNMELAPEYVAVPYGEHVRAMQELHRLRDVLDDIILDRGVPKHIVTMAQEARYPVEERIWRQ